MAVARKLKNLTIREVSSVSHGAGEGVKILLMKRRDDPADKTRKTHDDAELNTVIAKAIAALAATVAAINKDIDDPAEREDALLKGISDFNTHMAEVIGHDAGDGEMSKEILEKLDAMQADIAFAKMTDVHKSYAVEMKLAGEALTKFVAADAAGRDAVMKEFPPKKEKKPGEKEDDETCKVLKMDQLPVEVVTRLQKADADSIVLKGLQEAAEVTKFENRAVELGLTKAHGATIRKAYAGDAAAQADMDKLLKGLTEQVRTGKVFEQFGADNGGRATDAMGEVRAKAAELRKAVGHDKMTDAQSIEKVLSDPANAELAKRERDERMLKIGGGVRAA